MSEQDNVVLRTIDLVKTYNKGMPNEFEALHKINFDVHEGDLICIMGPSGSGKTTFINNISTIDTPTAGKVYINGAEVKLMSANEIGRFRNKNLGFIFQEFNLLNTHTIFENIAMPLALAKVPKAEIKKRVESITEAMNIWDHMYKYPQECSGGQRQRAAICRALITSPKIIIADEPTGNLDSKNSTEFLQIIEQLNKVNNVTVVMVTHDAFAASFATKLLYIKDGEILAILERGEKNQKEFFDEISELNARESREALL
ncbi:MAG: ABC transporter ATP-binding protein [Erysipelotrichaceae bacterium]|nr:ABC transporter ATP-binding protein [Erysipelotrichaceae bacterium]